MPEPEIINTPTHRLVLNWQPVGNFRQTVTGRRPCKQKCNKCGVEWGKTGTTFVNLAQPKDPANPGHLYWCDGCAGVEAENNGEK